MYQSKTSASGDKSNLLWTIPNIKVHYILVAKFPHGKKSLKILATSFPNPNTRFWLCYCGLFTNNFLPFCNCLHEVNMTHARHYLTHLHICGHAC
jgi:CDGSH-type Zn-finger protein